MVLRFEDNQGIQALDQNQIIEVFSGNSVSNGVDTTVNSGTLGQSDTIQVGSGDVIVGGSKVSVSQQNQQIDSSDADNPRKDVVFVDSTGNVQVDKGTPEDPEPEGANRFDLFQPAPPERDGVDGAVIAEVFVGAGVSSISSNDVRDRRLISNLTVDQLQFFDSLNFGDDRDLRFGDAPDFSIRYDSNDDELKIRDEVNDTEKQAFDKSGDVFIRNGALQVGQDIQTLGATTIWDSNNSEIPDVALGSIENTTLTNDSITVANNTVSLGGSTSLATTDLTDQNISTPLAGQTILYDATNSEFVNAEITAGTALGSSTGDGSFTLNVQEGNINHDNLSGFVSNEHIDHSSVTVTGTGALTGGGDLTGSRMIDVATDGIGTDELDESASFDFSSTISFDGGIDTSSGELQINPTGDFRVTSGESIIESGSDRVLQINQTTNGGSPRLEFQNPDDGRMGYIWSRSTSDTSTVELVADVADDIHIDAAKVDLLASTEIIARSSLDMKNNNINDVASIDGGGDAVVLNDNLTIESLANKIVVKGASSASGLQLENTDGGFSRELNFINTSSGTTRRATIVSNNGDLQLLSSDGSTSGQNKRINIVGGSGTQEVDIENANLDLNDNLIKDVSNNTTGDSMTANPETDAEDGYIEVEIDGTTRQIPFYNS